MAIINIQFFFAFTRKIHSEDSLGTGCDLEWDLWWIWLLVKEALENFLEPRRGRMFVVLRSLRCQPRRGGMSLRAKVYAAPNGPRKSACRRYYKHRTPTGLPSGALDRRSK